MTLRDRRRRAPWPDFAGNPIFEGDAILHPDGDEAVVVYGGTRPNGEAYEGEGRWRAAYADGTNLYLGRQVADRGMAVVISPDLPQHST